MKLRFTIYDFWKQGLDPGGGDPPSGPIFQADLDHPLSFEDFDYGAFARVGPAGRAPFHTVSFFDHGHRVHFGAAITRPKPPRGSSARMEETWAVNFGDVSTSFWKDFRAYKMELCFMPK